MESGSSNGIDTDHPEGKCFFDNINNAQAVEQINHSFNIYNLDAAYFLRSEVY